MNKWLFGSIAVALAAPASQRAIAQDEPFVEEIVVTAQRREEPISEVAIAITAADREDLALARIEDIGDLDVLSTSYHVTVSNQAQSSTNVIIRGIGTVGNARSFEGSVGVTIDGVYRTRAGAALESFLDIGNVQIVRGPQGTLFGKNTTAGALLVDSVKPALGESFGEVSVAAGNFSAIDVAGAYNFSASDSAALRVALMYDQTDSFWDEINAGDDFDKQTEGAKIQYLYQPSDTFSAHLILDYLESDARCCYQTVRVSDLTGGALGNAVDALGTAAGAATPSRNPDDYESGITGENRQIANDEGATIKLRWDTAAGTWQSITALRNFSMDQDDVDADFEAADLLRLNEDFESEFFSQEFTFSGVSDRNAYVLGIFYSDEQIEATRQLGWGIASQPYWVGLISQQIQADTGQPAAVVDPLVAGSVSAPPGVFSDELYDGDNRSFALFAHNVFDLSADWKLVTGLRWSREERDGAYLSRAFDLQIGPNPLSGFLGGPDPAPRSPFVLVGNGPGPEFDTSFEDDEISGTLGLQYFFGDDDQVYATFNRGFKSGGVNMDISGAGVVANNPALGGPLPPLDPSYDSEVLQSVELGLKTTYWDKRANTNFAVFYNDIEDFQIAAFRGLQFTVFNADSATSYGLEFENVVYLNDQFSVQFNGTYIPEAEYDEDPQLSPALSGQRFRWTPEIALNTSLNFERAISPRHSFFARLQYFYRDEQFVDTDSDAQDDGRDLVNATVGLRNDSGAWSLEVWANNLTDEVYPTLVFPTPLQTGISNAYLGAPRTFGIALRANF